MSIASMVDGSFLEGNGRSRYLAVATEPAPFLINTLSSCRFLFAFSPSVSFCRPLFYCSPTSQIAAMLL